MCRVKASNKSNVRANWDLERPWGKSLTLRDAKVCRALGWAEQRVDGSGEVWLLTNFTKSFRSTVHIDGRPREYEMDELVTQFFLPGPPMANLSPYFKRGSDRDWHLRILVTLIHLVLDGYATCSEADGRLNFVGLESLRTYLTYERYSMIIDELVRNGEYVRVPGQQLAARLTPHGFFGHVADGTLNVEAVRPLLEALKQRGLVRQSSQAQGEGWASTAEGLRQGFGSKDTAFDDLLKRFGLRDLFEAAIARTRSEADVAIQSEEAGFATVH